MRLNEIIIQKIEKEGPISFYDFMEMALYYPELGYYNRDKEHIGPAGDFYTSATLTPVFGAMIAKQLEEMWSLMGKKHFSILEYGAGTGALSHSILQHLRSNEELYAGLNYLIVEKGAAMQKKQRSLLNEKVSWHDSARNIPEVTGCVISNELVDNFAVHRVVMEEELKEVFVDHNSNGFVEILRPASDALKNYFAELRIALPRGFRTEVNLEAKKWMEEIAVTLKKGYVVTIDYGYSSAELYSEERKEGTLKCYSKHKVNSHPYSEIGEQDITSHVNFSALCLWGYKSGLGYCGYTDQGNFLSSLGFRNYIKSLETPENIYKNFRQEMSLTHTLLGDMGSKFKVLIQKKDVTENKLSGLSTL
ncbi:MAG: class I SAM-dependent methyltransferase [Bacteroidia bacterium]